MLGLPLVGQVALVTGAGRGIGREMTRWFAAAGAHVAICARRTEGIDALSAELAADGTAVFAASCDVSDPDSVRRFVERTLERYGRIDVAVANAATLGPVGGIAHIDPRAFAETLSCNVAGVASLVQTVLPAMTAQGHGRILTLSGGGVGGPSLPARVSAYVASKGAVLLLTEVLALELPPGVTINAIAPGAVPTGFMDEVLTVGPTVAGDDLFAAVQQTAMPDLTPLRELVLYLASATSTWLNGRCLSARWDSPAALEVTRSSTLSPSRYRLRRIDEDLYSERRGASA